MAYLFIPHHHDFASRQKWGWSRSQLWYLIRLPQCCSQPNKEFLNFSKRTLQFKNATICKQTIRKHLCRKRLHNTILAKFIFHVLNTSFRASLTAGMLFPGALDNGTETCHAWETGNSNDNISAILVTDKRRNKHYSPPSPSHISSHTISWSTSHRCRFPFWPMTWAGWGRGVVGSAQLLHTCLSTHKTRANTQGLLSLLLCTYSYFFYIQRHSLKGRKNKMFNEHSQTSFLTSIQVLSTIIRRGLHAWRKNTVDQ